MRTTVKVILGLALLGSLFGAGWRVYRRLPSDATLRNVESAYGQANTHLIMMMSNGLIDATLNSPVELYPFDLTVIQREFQAYRRASKEFDDLLARRMQNVTPLKTPTDGKGRAVTFVSAGSWWLHATASLANGETLEWRLPLNIAGNEQTIELTTENAYERTKKF